jgi:hypothetical protein
MAGAARWTERRTDVVRVTVMAAAGPAPAARTTGGVDEQTEITALSTGRVVVQCRLLRPWEKDKPALDARDIAVEVK